MYVRTDGRRNIPKDIDIPKNYSGNAFSEADDAEEEVEIIEESEPVSVEVEPVVHRKKDFLSGFMENEELMLLGLILLLSLDGFGDDIIPILLIILFFKK